VSHSLNSLCLILLTVFAVASASGQSLAKGAKNVPSTKAALIDSTQKYKASSAELLRLQEEQVKRATEKLEQTKQLVSEGLVAKRELTENEQVLADLQGKVAATRRGIADADWTIAEVIAMEESDKSAQGNTVKSLTRPTILRYSSAGRWLLTNLPSVQAFFSTTLGRSLPISAFGQSATHNQLGWDHHNAVDVGVHPDSVEGKALLNYLQSHGIPFLAFRGAIPGIATGPHIHIGNPSSRL
jgi:hypothetical protein